MTKKTTVKPTAGSKAEPKPPAAATATPPAEVAKDPKRPIMSADSQPKFDPARVTPPNRGPQTGEANLSDQAYIATWGRPEEFKRWAGEIKARRSRPEPLAFFRCTNPTCRIVMRDRPDSPDNAPCCRCNLLRRAAPAGGHLKRMTDREVDDHLFREAQKDKLEDERRARARFNLENEGRAKSGLAPLTFEQFTAQERREFEELKQRGRDLEATARLYRRPA